MTILFSIALSLRITLATLIGAELGRHRADERSGNWSGDNCLRAQLVGDEVTTAGGEFSAHCATWKPMGARECIKVQITHPQGQLIQSGDLIASMTERGRA